MAKLKSAFELACERIISAPEPIKNTNEMLKNEFDFIEIPEFSNKSEKIIEDEDNSQKEPSVKAEIVNSDIKTEKPQKFYYKDKLMEVHWYGNFLDYGGFARMNRTMVFGLANKNVAIKTEIEPYLNDVSESTKIQLEKMSKNKIRDNAPKVFGSTMPMSMAHKGPKILYTMMETSEKVHKDYAEKCNMMNEIWVPTNYGKSILENSNVKTPIHVMPLGTDMEFYRPNCGIINFGAATRTFKFLSVFKWSYRKGFDILLRSFMEEFSSDEDVSLVLASRTLDRTGKVITDKIVEDFNAITSNIDKKEDKLPHVCLYSKIIKEQDMPKIYNSCDAFVLISRGEGFGLPYLESAAVGLPVIASNCTGQTEFLNSQNSFLVDPEGTETSEVNGKLPWMAKTSHFYQGQKFPVFGRESIEQTKSHMRYVFENYKEAQKKAQKLKQQITEKYTWDHAVNRVYNRLKEHQE